MPDVIEQILKNEFLPLEKLDTILSDDSKFSVNVEKLTRCLNGKIPIEIPNDAGVKCVMDGRMSLDHSTVTLRNGHGMTRDEEERYAKRLEFFKHRLLESTRSMSVHPHDETHLKGSVNCSGNGHSMETHPACEESGRCPEGKTPTVAAACLAYHKCRSIFLLRNLHLVGYLCRAYKTYDVPVMDLVQEGSIGLIRAVDKFDWRKKVRFQTYATFWVRQAVERAIGTNRDLVRIPHYMQQKIRRLKREGKLSPDQADHSAKEVSELFDIQYEVAGNLLESQRPHLSLDGAVFREGETRLAELVGSEEPQVSLDHEETETLKERLQELMDELAARERTVIRHRFRLGKARFKTYQELGEMLNLSRERVRQIQNRALEKLKHSSIKNRVACFI